jgi:hypothetical protein
MTKKADMSPEAYERKLQRDAEYRAKNKDKINARIKRNYYENRERRLEAIAIYQQRREYNHLMAAIERLGGACQDCGNEDPRVLVFHHRDPATKEYDVSGRRLRLSLEKLFLEVDKCDLLCANCHLIRHRPKREPGDWEPSGRAPYRKRLAAA